MDELCIGRISILETDLPPLDFNAVLLAAGVPDVDAWEELSTIKKTCAILDYLDATPGLLVLGNAEVSISGITVKLAPAAF